MLEVIVQNKQEAVAAEKNGADRVELVSAIQEGGLTPSFGTLKQVLGSVEIPVQVMIRPHSYGYHYAVEDMKVIMKDVQAVMDLGGTGIVFGALNRDNTVDEQALSDIIKMASQLDIAFHRAFDEVQLQESAYRALAKYKSHVKRILTSGGAKDCGHGKEQLGKLVHLANQLDGPSIMPGSGLSSENIQEVHEAAGAREYHFGKAVRIDRSFQHGFDYEALTRIKRIIH